MIESTMNVTLTEEAIEVEATLVDAKAVDRLIKILEANRALLADGPRRDLTTPT